MCLNMLEQKPADIDFTEKFRAKAKQTKQMEDCWRNDVYGGPIF
jgi:hypothetical protein